MTLGVSAETVWTVGLNLLAMGALAVAWFGSSACRLDALGDVDRARAGAPGGAVGSQGLAAHSRGAASASLRRWLFHFAARNDAGGAGPAGKEPRRFGSGPARGAPGALRAAVGRRGLDLIDRAKKKLASGAADVAGPVHMLLGAVLVVQTSVASGGSRASSRLRSFFACQQVENHLLQPLVQRKTIKMNPVLIVAVMLAGSSLAGVNRSVAGSAARRRASGRAARRAGTPHRPVRSERRRRVFRGRHRGAGGRRGSSPRSWPGTSAHPPAAAGLRARSTASPRVRSVLRR